MCSGRAKERQQFQRGIFRKLRQRARGLIALQSLLPYPVTTFTVSGGLFTVCRDATGFFSLVLPS